jgi:hypothetical protein
MNRVATIFASTVTGGIYLLYAYSVRNVPTFVRRWSALCGVMFLGQAGGYVLGAPARFMAWYLGTTMAVVVPTLLVTFYYQWPGNVIPIPRTGIGWRQKRSPRHCDPSRRV